ncbi:MAG: hypothetical protein H5U34_02085, partial [Klebsiella pneumoniae]|nr:hypothetical protein [Klebsiella pneumoniae]
YWVALIQPGKVLYEMDGVPEELQKVTGERGRRGSLMRGLQKIDRVEIDSPRRAAAGDSEE